MLSTHSLFQHSLHCCNSLPTCLLFSPVPEALPHLLGFLSWTGTCIIAWVLMWPTYIVCFKTKMPWGPSDWSPSCQLHSLSQNSSRSAQLKLVDRWNYLISLFTSVAHCFWCWYPLRHTRYLRCMDNKNNFNQVRYRRGTMSLPTLKPPMVVAVLCSTYVII